MPRDIVGQNGALSAASRITDVHMHARDPARFYCSWLANAPQFNCIYSPEKVRGRLGRDHPEAE
jgi:hypothetical protein